MIQPRLDITPIVEQDPSEDNGIAQVGRELRRSLVQPSLQRMVNSEFKTDCPERDLKAKKGNIAKSLAENKVNDSILSSPRDPAIFVIEDNQVSCELSLANLY